MNGWPIYCGHGPDGRACPALASVIVEGATRRAVACEKHRAAVERWATNGGKSPVTTRNVEQPENAVAADGQGTLFDLGGAA